MIPNRARNAAQWPFDQLLVILLRQFKRLLAEQGVELTDKQVKTIAQDAANRQPADATTLQVREALIKLVEASQDVLAAWDLSYAEALNTGMDQMPGWETTAEFLALANEKGNAELRISAGSALLAGLGDKRFAHHLLATFENGKDDPEDVDAVISKRALNFLAALDQDAPD